MSLTWSKLKTPEAVLPLPKLGPAGKHDKKRYAVYLNPTTKTEVGADIPGGNWHLTCPRGWDCGVVFGQLGRPSEALSFDEVFRDLELKTGLAGSFMRGPFSEALVDVTCLDGDAEAIGPALLARAPARLTGLPLDGLLVFLLTVQVPEHFRYQYMEPEGGRFLLPRFTLGVIHSRWPADVAVARSGAGNRGLRFMRNNHGMEPAFATVRPHRPQSDCGCREA